MRVLAKLLTLVEPLTFSLKDYKTLWVQGDIAIAEGNQSKAKSIYRHLATRRPRNAEDYRYSGLSAYRLNNPEKAADLLEAGIDNYPAAEYLLEHYLLICVETGQIDRAIRGIEPDAKNEQQACEVLFDKIVGSQIQLNLIEHCLKRGFLELVERKVSPLLEGNQDAMTLWRLAEILSQHERSTETDAIYRRLSERTPKSAEDYRYSGLSAYRLNNPEKAADLLEAGLENYPAAGHLLEHHRHICLELGQFDRVIRWFEPDAKNEMQACEALFDGLVESNTQVNLIEHCLKRGFAELADRKVSFLLENCQDAVTLWRLADILLLYESSNEAWTIYRRLSERRLETAEDYQYAGLSEYRLRNPEKAADLLEAGLENYPAAGNLLEHYLHVCLESGQIDRAIRLIEPDAKNEKQACEVLFDKLGESHFQVNLIDHCLKRGFSELAERKVSFLLENSQDVVTLWTFGELLSKYERSNEARTIYRRLSECRPETPEDYYCIGLAWLRLENIESCLDTFERGQTRYPESRDISTIYLLICAQWCNHDRYFRFFNGIQPGPCAPAKTMLEFYRAVFNSDAYQSFVSNVKELEFKCDAVTFDCLKREFLSLLQKNPQSFHKARVMIFYIKYLDGHPDFSAKLLETLQSSCKTRNKDGEAEAHMLQLLHDLTPPMIPHYATDPDAVVHQFILASKSLSTSQIELAEPIEDMTSDWTPWANIFCLVAPELYGNAISAFEQLAFNIWPKLNFTAPHVCKATNSPRSLQKKIRIGFVVHDAMPMMSGLLSHLDKRIFETVFLRPGKAGKSPAAKNWVARADRTVEYSDVNTYSAIQTIANEELDIIVSCPYMAAIFYPMMARLAPLQIVLLEPNWTDGLTNADYYISWQQAEPANPGDYYKSAVSFLQHPPYWIERPLLDINLPISEDARSDIRRRVLGLGPESRIYLCANTPPKIHPAMDDIFYDLLERDQTGFLVLLRSEFPPVRTLKIRLREKLGKYYDRIIFLPTLSKEDAHLLLQSVDCCLDSYPLCGMSSSFDGAMLGVPIVTLPCDIPFGRWTAAIYEYIGVSGLTAKDREDYIDIATRLASDKIWRHQLSIEIKEKSSCYVESKASCEEFQDFIIRSWERRTSGLPPSNWLSGRWQ